MGMVENSWRGEEKGELERSGCSLYLSGVRRRRTSTRKTRTSRTSRTTPFFSRGDLAILALHAPKVADHSLNSDTAIAATTATNDNNINNTYNKNYKGIGST